MAWYGIGTIALTNGSKTVTGTGVGWTIENIRGGDALLPDAAIPVEIESVDGPTQLTLRKPWFGATTAATGYSIIPTQDYNATSATKLAQLMLRYQTVADTIGQGMFPAGTNAAPGLRFAADQDTGFTNPAANAVGVVTGGVERVRVTAAGTVGINTSNPSGAIEVVGNGSQFLNLSNYSNLVGETVGGVRFNSRATANGWHAGVEAFVPAYAQGVDSVALAFKTNATVRAVIDPAGNLGVGTITPASLVEFSRQSDAVATLTALTSSGFAAGVDFKRFGGAVQASIRVVAQDANDAGKMTISLRRASDLTMQDVLTLSQNGNVGFGIASPVCKVVAAGGTALTGNRTTYQFGVAGPDGFPGLTLGQGADAYIQTWSRKLVINPEGNDVIVCPVAGNLLVGTAIGTSHTISKPAAAGVQVLSVESSSTALPSAYFYGADGVGLSGAAHVIGVFKNNTTGRSMNAGGTINASGADMAEYKRKAAECGAIAKGDVCGVTATNELTKKWGAAIDFVIKTTRPHTVGGDTWGTPDSVTPDGERVGEKPVEPAEVRLLDIPEIPEVAPFDEPAPAPFDEPEPAAFNEPEPETPAAPPAFDEVPPVDASDEDLALWAERESAARAARYRYLAAMKPVEQWAERRQAAATAHAEWAVRRDERAAAIAAHAAGVAAHDDARAARELAVQARDAALAKNAAERAAWQLAHAAYVADLMAWEARHEAARANVDRIAIAGQCPVNVTGAFAAGDYIVAMPNGSGIKAVAFSPAAFLALDPLDQLRKVARCWGVTERFVEMIDGVEVEVWPAGLAWCAVSVG